MYPKFFLLNFCCSFLKNVPTISSHQFWTQPLPKILLCFDILTWSPTLNIRPSLLFSLLKWMSVCSYQVKYAYKRQSTLFSCMNVKEPLAQNRRNIWGLSDSNRTQAHNHIVHKRTLNHFANLAIDLVFVYELSGREFESRRSENMCLTLYQQDSFPCFFDMYCCIY